jgi:hypothetical protein
MAKVGTQKKKRAEETVNINEWGHFIEGLLPVVSPVIMYSKFPTQPFL